MDHERTILQAAANLLYDRAIEMAQTREALDAATAGLLASKAITAYLAALDELERPF